MLQPVAATMPIDFGAVDLARGGDEHAQRGRLAAAGARAGAADVADGVLAEHQVGQRLLVAVDGRRRRQGAEEAHVARGSARATSRRSVAGDTLSIMRSASWPRCGADLDALAAALAVDGFDEDAELCRLVAVALGTVRVLLRLGEMGVAGRAPRSAAPAAKPAMAGLEADAGWAMARIAVSGQVVDAAMQPTQRAGIEGGDPRRERREVARRRRSRAG